MSNVTVQEALKKSLARFQMIDAGQTIFVRDAIDDCKAALAEIDKCEPVAWKYFDEAYKKATESSEPDDWMNAALMAQQVRRKQLNTKG